MLEFAGVDRHYHSALMRTILIGKPDPQQVAMHKAGMEAMKACEAALKPGRPIGDVFDAYARTFDAAGFGKYRYNACGYSRARPSPRTGWTGRCSTRTTRSWPSPTIFFMHMVVIDADRGLAMAPGYTVEVTKDGCVPLSRCRWIWWSTRRGRLPHPLMPLMFSVIGLMVACVIL